MRNVCFPPLYKVKKFFKATGFDDLLNSYGCESLIIPCYRLRDWSTETV